MRRVGPLAVAVLSAGLLVSACGGGGSRDTAGDAGGASTPPTASASTSTSAGPSAPASSLDPSLAAEAQSLAASAQAQVSSMPTSAPVAPQEGPVLGGDISWPQCPPGLGIPHKKSKGLPLPGPDAEFVVIGLTNGPGFYANPCLADQVAYAQQAGLLVSAYSVISWPGDKAIQQYGTPQDAGYAQAQFDIKLMKRTGLTTPFVWLDVEPVPFYDWPPDVATNAEVVKGAAEGFLDAGFRVGVYSTPYLWRGVVGDLSLGVPEWRAAGQTSQAEALNRCGPDWSIQGGDAVLGQWVEQQRDRNVTCPGQSAHLAEYFAATG